MPVSTEELIAKIERNATVTGSVLEFIEDLKEDLADESTPAEDRLSAALVKLDESTDKLAAAIVSNTVAASETVTDPAPVDPAPTETVTTETTSQVQ
ncbi:hypothetical protein [Rhodomicrobium lacus]|uniref:hypothetical protein n=1 Tax=Rhodomicrobium lacus TaxID=2498452 RepID=UPI000F8F4D19|nr:hypothetical protein [Rhodomicrobium lacus]